MTFKVKTCIARRNFKENEYQQAKEFAKKVKGRLRVGIFAGQGSNVTFQKEIK